MGALVGHVSKTDVDGGELTNRRERWWNWRTDVDGGELTN